MSQLKTTPNDTNVTTFLNQIKNDQKRADAFKILELMENITGESPKMWGGNIIGFGTYHYKYESGREGDWFLAGFSPRKTNFSLYIMAGFARKEALMAQLGKHKVGKACLYLKKLEDVNLEILEELIRESVTYMRAKHPA